MTAKIIDGRALARQERVRLRERIVRLAARGVVPGLAVVMVGDNPASALYVRNKVRACQELGMRSWVHGFASDVAEPGGVGPMTVTMLLRNTVHAAERS